MLNSSLDRLRSRVEDVLDATHDRADAFRSRIVGSDPPRRIAALLAVTLVPAALVILALGDTRPLAPTGPIASSGGEIGVSVAEFRTQSQPLSPLTGAGPDVSGGAEPASTPSATPDADRLQDGSGATGQVMAGGVSGGTTAGATTPGAPFPSGFAAPFIPLEQAAWPTPPPTVPAPAPAPTPAPDPTLAPGTPQPATPPPDPTPPTPPPPDPTPAPTPPPPAPTPAPTPPPPDPTPAPTPPPPDPTPDPTPRADTTCSNGIDDDGDLLVDLVDLGCILGDSEFDA